MGLVCWQKQGLELRAFESSELNANLHLIRSPQLILSSISETLPAFCLSCSLHSTCYYNLLYIYIYNNHHKSKKYNLIITIYSITYIYICIYIYIHICTYAHTHIRACMHACITLQDITLHYISYITLHYITLHYKTQHNITHHFTTLHNIAQHCIT